jgi:hypothetical protein
MALRQRGNGRSSRHFRQTYNLPKHTPTPKLNRYAESAVLNFYG